MTANCTNISDSPTYNSVQYMSATPVIASVCTFGDLGGQPASTHDLPTEPYNYMGNLHAIIKTLHGEYLACHAYKSHTLYVNARWMNTFL